MSETETKEDPQTEEKAPEQILGEVLLDVANQLDEFFNGELRGEQRRIGYVLTFFDYNVTKSNPDIRYLANVKKKDSLRAIELMRQRLRAEVNLETRVHVPGIILPPNIRG